MKPCLAVSISILLLLFLSFTGCGSSGNGEEKYTLTVTVIGEGTVLKDPNKTDYLLGDEIKLTAVPEPSWEFEHWEGFLSGSESPTSVTMYEDM